MTLSLRQERELELWKRYKFHNDLAAGQELMKSMAPIINQQVAKYAGVALPKASIELEAKKLIYKAFDTYNPKLSQLNTHVINYLKKLQRFVINYQNVGHIPEPRARQIGRYNTIYDNLESEKGREPTTLELADAMTWPVAEVEKLQLELRSDLSIDSGSGDDEEMGRFFEFMSNPYSPEQFRVKQAIEFVYYDVDPIDKKIMEYSFGLSGMPKLKDKDIAVRLGMSPQQLSKRKKKLGQVLREVTQV